MRISIDYGSLPSGVRPDNLRLARLDNTKWFTGKQYDAESGLSYMGARYYDPLVGRFMGIDPVGFDDGNIHSFNRYAYGNNNPYRYRDPDGRASVFVFAGVLTLGALTIAVIDNALHPERPSLIRKALSKLLQGNIAHNETANSGDSEGANGDAGSKKPAAGNGENSNGRENTNPYKGPVDMPVIVVDPNGNAIPVGKGERIKTSPNGDYQQVDGSDSKPTGVRLDRGGHKNQADPNARGPHAHRPGVTTPDGNPHLPINK